LKKNWEYETCALCTREQRLVWTVDNVLWNRVVIDYYHKQIICLECFLRMAEDRYVSISIDNLHITEVI